MALKRTHNCGKLRKGNAGEEVVLCGWVASWRDHGGLVFIDIRDRYGKTQVVFNPERAPEAHAVGRRLRSEYVVAAKGVVSLRPEDMINPNMATGEIEVYIDEVELLSKCDNPPIEVEYAGEIVGDNRFRYRYLDLRRPVMQENFIFRHRLAMLIRRHFDENGFLEIETPFLTKSTPEGARDYLVPSRVNAGHFYALPQSPQLFKQLLMVAGFDRYFQIVRCFRDEDLRAQRQPEFTQLDVEMSFVEESDIIEIVEGLFVRLFSEILGEELEAPFERISYSDSMLRYGTDAPDMRFGMEIREISEIAAECEFKVFTGTVENGGVVRGICVPGGARLSRKDIDELTDFVRQFGAKGLAWFKIESGRPQSSISKFFSETQLGQIAERMEATEGDLLLFVAADKAVAEQSLDQLRRHLAQKLDMIAKGSKKLVWVENFPLFEYSREDKRLVAIHHPFTMPLSEDVELLETEPLKVRSMAYDLVMNGIELGGGSIRIHDPEVQRRVLNALGIGAEEADARFGFLLEALRYGAPPHGGIAFGLDRLTAMLLGQDDIRETIAFPKTQKAVCPLTGAPSTVDDEQLRELHISLRKKR